MYPETTRVVHWHVAVALALFALQILFGLISVLHFVFPDFQSGGLLEFNVSRTVHINLLVVWLLMGFFGATYHVVSEESQCEIYSPKLALGTLAAFAGGGVVGIIGYIFFHHWQGREFLELPAYLDVAVVAVVLAFLFNAIMTVWRGERRTSVEFVLLLGLVLMALLYFPGNLYFANEAMQSFYWWWTIHLWVEGVWELIMGSMLAFMLIKMTGVDREIMEKWLYVVVSLTLFTGILGLGHHYYWIGTPNYWLFIGAFFSALEPLAFVAMILYAIYARQRSKREHPNRAALLWTIGCTIMATVGILIGFAQTLPNINSYTHGTHVTTSHGHYAFFGAYAMINLAFFSYLLPRVNGIEADEWDQSRNIWSFWLMVVSMVGLSVSTMIAGVVQTVFERMKGVPYITVQEMPTMVLAYQLWLLFGLIFAVGTGLFLYDFFRPARVKEDAVDRLADPVRG